MDIGEAVRFLREGHNVRRAGWNGKGMWIVLLSPAEWTTSLCPVPEDRLAFVAMKTADDKMVPWLCSQTDLLATDWEVVR